VLTLRPPQLLALSPEAERFTATLRAALAHTFPHRFPTADEPELHAFVERSCAVALAHGILLDAAVSRLAYLRAAYGEAFELTPVADTALALLRDPGLPGPIKIAAIEQCLVEATGGRPVTLVPDPQE
jgi:hypothetical protein